MDWKETLHELPPVGMRVLGVDPLGKMASTTYRGAGYFAPSGTRRDVEYWTVMDDELMQGWRVCDGSHEPIMHTILVRNHRGQIHTDFIRETGTKHKKEKRFAESGLDPKESGLEWREMPEAPASKHRKAIDLDGKMREV